jgi:elongation of very long chain fatty acids protein 4
VSFLHIYHHTTIAWAWWIALRYSPGGDIYFGALLNSAIHVLMYSYYALALMKVRCPWKRYLTQAQLLQFTSVVIYTIATAYLHYHHGSPEAIEGVQPSLGTYYFCCVVQVFEMVSLFVLFSLFYKRKYSSSMNDDGGGGGSRREQRSNDADRSTSSSSSSSSARAAESSSSSEDQCYRAMGEISEAAKEVAGHAAKDAGKVVAAATKAVTRGNGKGRVGANVM